MMAKLKGSYASAQIRAGARGRRVTGARPHRSGCQNAFARAAVQSGRSCLGCATPASGFKLGWPSHESGVPIDGPASASNNSRKGIKRTANPFEYVQRAASRNQDISQSHLIRRLGQSPTIVRPSFRAEDKSFFCRTGSTLSTRGEVQFVGVLQSKFAAGISDGDEEIQQRERRWTRFTIC
jgi:hypothetical protein